MEYSTAHTGKSGQWQEFRCSDDYVGFVLTCGSLFHAHIVRSGGKFYTSFNGKPNPNYQSFEEAQRACEKEIVRRVMEMLPAYKVILARVKGATVSAGE